jgi:hypothetical protein
MLGWMIFEFGFIVVLITSTHFASEAVPNDPGPALAVVIGAKNVVSFAASFGIIPMVHKYNYMVGFMIVSATNYLKQASTNVLQLFGVFAGILLLGVPIYLLNPKWRAYVGKRDRA